MFIKVFECFFGVSLGPLACEAVVIDAKKTISVLNQYNRFKKVTGMLVYNLMALRGRYCLYAPECQRHRKMDASEFHRPMKFGSIHFTMPLTLRCIQAIPPPQRHEVINQHTGHFLKPIILV